VVRDALLRNLPENDKQKTRASNFPTFFNIWSVMALYEDIKKPWENNLRAFSFL